MSFSLSEEREIFHILKIAAEQFDIWFKWIELIN